MSPSVADVVGLAGGDLTDATLTRIAITVGTASIGAGGIGISVTGGALYVASVTSGTRNWQTIESSLATGSLTGIEGLTLELADLEVKFNTASDSANPAAVVPVIDWTTMVNSGPLSVTRADGTDYALTLTGKVTRVAATITELNLFDFVTATDGGIADESSVADVTGLAGGDLTDATLTRIAITVGTASIGAGGIGISVTGGARTWLRSPPGRATGRRSSPRWPPAR